MYKGQIGLTRFTDNELSRITMNSMKMFLLCAMRLKGTVVYLGPSRPQREIRRR